MNLRFPPKERFFAGWETISFTRRTLLHVVCSRMLWTMFPCCYLKHCQTDTKPTVDNRAHFSPHRNVKLRELVATAHGKLCDVKPLLWNVTRLCLIHRPRQQKTALPHLFCLLPRSWDRLVSRSVHTIPFALQDKTSDLINCFKCTCRFITRLVFENVLFLDQCTQYPSLCTTKPAT
jgi:hypothetical protein